MSAINVGLAQALAALDDREFLARWRDLDDAHRLDALRHRFRYDLSGLLRWCFPDRFDLAWSPVHRAFLGDEAVHWRERDQQQHRLDIAPRGGAKSSIKSFGDIAHRVGYGLEVCVLIFSTGYQLAEDLVKDLYGLFSGKDPGGERFRQLLGPFKVSGTQTAFVVQGPLIDRDGVQIAAKSFGGTVRGHKHAGRRPSLIVLDDTVNPKHLKNPAMRDTAWKFLNSDILKAGFRYTEFQMVGTVQHPDDLVSRAAKNPTWRTRQWQNLISWPTRTDLWQACRELWANLTDADRVKTASRFYREHHEEMNEGAAVLWPEGRDLFALMIAFWSDPASFYAEDMNQPRSAGDQVFDTTKIRRCRVEGTRIYTSRGTVVEFQDCEFGIWLDPSSGKDDADHPALAVVARDPWGYRYAIHVEGARRSPSAQQAALWGLWERFSAYRPRVGADATGTQGLLGEAFDREREARRASRRPWNLWPLLHTFGEDKNGRIGSLEPDLVNGWLELAVDLPEEVNTELRDHPNAVHDDHLDALQAADALVCERIAGAVHSSRSIRG